MQKRVIMVHGWASDPNDCWMPWLKQELEKRDFVVTTPFFPEPKIPDICQWIDILEETIGTPDKETYLIGHSLGCTIILKYLERLTENESVGGIVTVGGRYTRVGFPVLKPEVIQKRTKHFSALFSDDDYYIPLSEEEAYRNELKAKTTILHGHGHFSRKENMTQLPEALSELLEMSK